MRKLIKQIMRFGIVGFICFFIDYVIMVLLTEVVGLDYLTSSGISFTVSVVVNYILSLKYVFRTTDKNSKFKEFIIFVVLSIIGLGINQILMWASVSVFGIFYMLSKVLATGIVMIYNFISRKIIIEKRV